MRIHRYAEGIASVLDHALSPPVGAVLLLAEIDSARGADVEVMRLRSTGLSEAHARQRVQRQLGLAKRRGAQALAMSWCDAKLLLVAIGTQVSANGRRILEESRLDPAVVLVHESGVEIVGGGDELASLANHATRRGAEPEADA